MKKIEHLRDILKKQDSLLVEFQRRQEYDTKQYHLVQPDEAIKHFLLVRIRDNEKVIFGTPKRIKSYLNVRNISAEDVMDINIL
jgi:hypothetical protein